MQPAQLRCTLHILTRYIGFTTNADDPSSQFVKSLGAEAVFDYNDSDCSKKMNEHTGDKLSLVFDCVAEGDSTKICMAALSSDGGKIAALLPVSQENSRTNVTNEVCCHPCEPRTLVHLPMPC